MHPFTANTADSVSSLGELRLIAAIRRWLGKATPPSPFGIGDDCAVLPASRHPQLVTVDPVVYGEHFDDSIPARAVAAKLLKRNLSDIAAMGGHPRAAVIALALDPKVSTRWLEQFYRGLAATARSYGVPIAGGDITRQQGGLAATLTLIGEARGPRALTRRGAKIGDWIYVTGTLGGSILGHHHRFTPRLAEGSWLADRRDVRSLMDLSDGLAKDLHALTPERAVPSLIGAAIPISAAARTLAKRDQRSALTHALSDGEDFELLFTVAARTDRSAFETAWRKKFKTRLTCIGRFTRTLEAGALNPDDFTGYEHLR
ncbi:thiamine-phosphate kinase [Rariglobus hedericola]|uniref:Thiamine-monophosphate kinase n=1 Tax=Rariglobus hedericola TaxID=2597822 RepID=A0A556QQI1_9BACT|nr:thiamine-phosphate kinase [Rariglobus hedericola]TSJ78896.1 thiamine-phosphate kinase [Rariglobus hedericola]